MFLLVEGLKYFENYPSVMQHRLLCAVRKVHGQTFACENAVPVKFSEVLCFNSSHHSVHFHLKKELLLLWKM